MKSYGITSISSVTNETDFHLENIRLKGFSIANNVISKQSCSNYCKLIDEVYEIQQQEFGYDDLKKINELDLARMPFLYKDDFFNIFMNSFVLDVCRKILDNVFILHLQNGIINRPNFEHHQTSWHRDLPYQDWVISKPIAFSALFCLTDFTNENGATELLPFSHKIDYFPNEKYVEENKIKIIAPAGSVILFDSMLYHRACNNSSKENRYALNNMFVVPILKQQIDIPTQLNLKEIPKEVKQILGFDYITPNSIHQFRLNKLKKNG